MRFSSGVVVVKRKGKKKRPEKRIRNGQRIARFMVRQSGDCLVGGAKVFYTRTDVPRTPTIRAHIQQDEYGRWHSCGTRIRVLCTHTQRYPTIYMYYMQAHIPHHAPSPISSSAMRRMLYAILIQCAPVPSQEREVLLTMYRGQGAARSRPLAPPRRLRPDAGRARSVLALCPASRL
jgi:hypothetical protein